MSITPQSQQVCIGPNFRKEVLIISNRSNLGTSA